MKIDSIIDESILLTGISIAKPDKRRCGDAFEIQKIRVLNSIFYVSVVADGVSTKPMDYLASKVACENFIGSFQKEDESIEKQLIRAVEAANKAVIENSPSHENMQTTLVAFVWEIKSKVGYFLSIGDSRIYLFRKNQWQCLTKDDSTRKLIQIKNSGKTKETSSIGKDVLSKSLGRSIEIDVSIQTVELNHWDNFLLCTDGWYNQPTFEFDMKEVIESSNIEKTLSELATKNAGNLLDDGTVVLVRIEQDGAVQTDVVWNIIKNNFDYQEYFNKGEMANHLLKLLEEASNKGAEYEIVKILEYMEQNLIYPSKEKLIGILNQMVKHQSKKTQQLASIIRRL